MAESRAVLKCVLHCSPLHVGLRKKDLRPRVRKSLSSPQCPSFWLLPLSSISFSWILSCNSGPINHVHHWCPPLILSPSPCQKPWAGSGTVTEPFHLHPSHAGFSDLEMHAFSAITKLSTQENRTSQMGEKKKQIRRSQEMKPTHGIK